MTRPSLVYAVMKEIFSNILGEVTGSGICMGVLSFFVVLGGTGLEMVSASVEMICLWIKGNAY